MSKRRRDRGINDNFLSDATDTSPDDSMSLSALANSGYGSQVEPFPELAKGRVKVSLLPIAQILPDYAQPRRAIPSQVRQYWDGTTAPEAFDVLFRRWIERAVEERGKPLDVDAYLRGGVTDRAPEKIDDDLSGKTHIGAYEWSLLKVIELAASIRRDGLTNPITVVARQDGYVIETGERRWLAYQLLNWHFGDSEDWTKIPARLMDKLSVWRQATENNNRADLNAIGRARQLALILMDLYTQQGETFHPFEIFKNEQAFYAQVADPLRYRVPYGKGELVLNAMGFEHKSSIKRYRDILTLPPDLWRMADDYNVPESVLRQMIGLNVEEQMALFNAWFETGRVEGVDRAGMLKDKPPSHLGRFQNLLRWEVQQWEEEFENLDQNAREMILQYLRGLLHTLEKRF